MTTYNPERLTNLAHRAGRGRLTSDETRALREGLAAVLAAIGQLQRDNKLLRSRNADYEQVIRNQCAELLAAQKVSNP